MLMIIDRLNKFSFFRAQIVCYMLRNLTNLDKIQSLVQKFN